MTVLESLKPFAGLMTVVAVGILLILFRAQIRQLVNWIVGFKRIAKSKEGYSLEGASEPEKAPVPVVDAPRDAVAAADAISTSSSEPGEADTWFKAYSENRFDDAVSLLEVEVQRATDVEVKSNFKSAIGYVKLEQNSAGGIAYFENLIREDPTKAYPYDWWAMQYLRWNLPEKCLAVIDRGLAAAHGKAMLLDTKSDCLLALGRIDDAIAAASQGVQEDVSYVANYSNLARLELKKGDKETARAWYLRALDASDGNEAILAEYARFLGNNGYVSETILRYRDLMNRDPKNSTYRTLAGNAYVVADLSSRALQAYQKANELAGEKEGWILANIGNIFNNRGFYAEAIKFFHRALELDPASQYAHERLAQAQQLEADEDKKVESLLDEARQTLNKEGMPSKP